MQGNEFRTGDLFGQIEDLAAQLETERQARLAAEAANVGTLGLIDIVSKKLRPPMESVSALTDRILDGPLNLAQRRDAESLSHSMHRILSALTEVLDFSTLQSGDAEFSVEPFDFHALVRETASALQACAAAKGLSSSVDMAANCPRYIVGDAMRVRQVLMALMETSIQATAGGSIRLYISVNDAVSPVTVRFDITDTSAGFTTEQLAALFQPSTDNMRSDGGLGLPIAQRLAEAMGGGVACDSALGQGALYWFTFKALVEEKETEAGMPAAQVAHHVPEDLVSAQPATSDAFELNVADEIAPKEVDPVSLETEWATAKMLDEPAPQSHPTLAPANAMEMAPAPAPGSAPKAARADALAGHVLLIEDNSVNRLLIGAYLDEFGLTFDVAETGAAALMCLDQRPYDLVLMDTVLPDYRGLQLAQRIRAMEARSAHVPIVALATLSDNEEEQAYVEAGVNASLDKPIQGRELYAALVPLVSAQAEQADDDVGWTPVF